MVARKILILLAVVACSLAEPCTREVVRIAGRQAKTITSPNYPTRYQTNRDPCRYDILGAPGGGLYTYCRLNIFRSSTGCFSNHYLAFLTLGRGYCGTGSLYRYTSRNTMAIEFRREQNGFTSSQFSAANSQGFTCRIFSFARSGTPAPGPQSNCECQSTSISKRIYHGQSVDIEQVPWMVGLVIDGRGLCGGSIISSTIVLTAAHCIDNVQRYVQVRYGSASLFRGYRSTFAKACVTHPLWRDNFQYDIGFLVLRSPITFSASVRPICLTRTTIREGTLGQTAGFGRNENNAITGVLKMIDETYHLRATCRRRIIFNWLDQHLCTDVSDNEGTCAGDSGSAHFYGTTQFGITSFGWRNSRGFCVQSRPSGIVNVAYFASWIQQRTGVCIPS